MSEERFVIVSYDPIIKSIEIIGRSDGNSFRTHTGAEDMMRRLPSQVGKSRTITRIQPPHETNTRIAEDDTGIKDRGPQKEPQRFGVRRREESICVTDSEAPTAIAWFSYEIGVSIAEWQARTLAELLNMKEAEEKKQKPTPGPDERPVGSPQGWDPRL